MTQEAGQRELLYRQSKILLRNVEQLLKPEEIEQIWTELLSFYDQPTRRKVRKIQISHKKKIFCLHIF